MPYLLMAMMAAGMVTDFLGAQTQEKLMNMGMKLDQAGLDANIEQLKLQSADESLQAIQNLRKTMGSQIAVMAARGTSMSGGSAVGLLNQSISNFGQDEKMRQLNTMAKESQLRANKISSYLQNTGDISKLWSGVGQRTFSKFTTLAGGR